MFRHNHNVELFRQAFKEMTEEEGRQEISREEVALRALSHHTRYMRRHNAIRRLLRKEPEEVPSRMPARFNMPGASAALLELEGNSEIVEVGVGEVPDYRDKAYVWTPERAVQVVADQVGVRASGVITEAA